MPTCIQVKLPGVVFTDTTLPILRPDSLMSDGSLFLADFGRAETFALGSVPGAGSQIGNIAWKTAQSIIGSGDAGTLAGSFEDTLSSVPSMGLIERTGRNGVGVIVSQTAADSASRHGGIALPALLRTFILSNLPGHSFYFSVWGRQTRAATTPTTSSALFGSVSSPSGSHAFCTFNPPVISPSSGGAYLGSRCSPPSAANGNMFRNVAVSDWTGVKPSDASTCYGVFYYGQRIVFSSFDANKAASGILYRVYIEDLSLSGRTYSQVDALDKALFDTAFGPGGRFSGDTFTNPSTLP